MARQTHSVGTVTRPFAGVSVLAVALLLLTISTTLVACGEKEETSGVGSLAAQDATIDEATVAQMEAVELQQTLLDAAQRLIDRHGSDKAANYAVLIACDSGYDPYQLLSGCLADRLEADGRILAADGSLLPPARAPEGIIEVAEARVLLLASLFAPVLLADTTGLGQSQVHIAGAYCDITTLVDMAIDEFAKERAKIKAEEHFHAYCAPDIMWLYYRGYSVEQIAGAVILGQIRQVYDPDTNLISVYIEHTSGVVLRPKHPPSNILVELSSPGAAPDAPDSFDPETVREAMGERGLSEDSEDGLASGDEATPGGGAPGPAGVQTPSSEDTQTPMPALARLNGTWTGTTQTVKASVEGKDISEWTMEGCDPTDIYRVTHKVTADLELRPDGSGVLSWMGDSVGLESSGLVETLPGGSSTIEWTWKDGRLRIVAQPESGGSLILEGELELANDESLTYEGTWDATGTEMLDETEFHLAANGAFTLTKPAEK